MRRMYSVQELSEIVSVVVGQKIEDGSFDEVIAGAVDDYLTENPIDVTALEGLDISVGSLDADGLVTGAEIIEKMTGYSYSNSNPNFSPAYAGVVKNGNKVTLVIAGTLTPPTISTLYYLGAFQIPAELYDKIYPITGDDVAYPTIELTISYASKVTGYGSIEKTNDNKLRCGVYVPSAATANQAYYLRVEVTFLLSENLAQ